MPLFQQQTGFTVERRSLKALGAEARGYIADLMDRLQVEKVVGQIIADFGAVDVLVNNAGMVQVGGAEDFSEFAGRHV